MPAAPSIEFPQDLPVSQMRGEIAAAIREHQVLIVAGETGSGKTTQLPKIALALGRERIAHTQPRRIAARTIAERIADEMGSDLGDLVGYQVRFTDKVSEHTKIRLMTDGILLNAIHRDRDLRAYDTIIIDEAHERSLNIDFLLGYLKTLLPRRPDLRVIITSATIDPKSFAKHFADANGVPAPIIEVSGRTYPVEIRYRPLVEDVSISDDGHPTPSRPNATPQQHPQKRNASTPGVSARKVERDMFDAIGDAVDELAREAPGDVLVFLSGEAEIRDATDALRGRKRGNRASSSLEVLPLYGRLSAAEQHRVFEINKSGTRRIVLATNVAETSLTVPGIRYVIDAGTARISRYSSRSKVQRLPIEAISQASANQRSGRSGRTSAGIAIRLYSEDDFESRSLFTEPEILRTGLASVILQMLALDLGEIGDFPFLTPPDKRDIRDGIALLEELGAVQAATTRSQRRGRGAKPPKQSEQSEQSKQSEQRAEGPRAKPASYQITRIGRELSRLPIEPRFARMVVESREHGVTDEVLAIVAGLTVQDVRERPVEQQGRADELHGRFSDPLGDLMTLLNMWNYLQKQQHELSSSAFRRLCKAEFLNFLRVREWMDLYRQLGRTQRPKQRNALHVARPEPASGSAQTQPFTESTTHTERPATQRSGQSKALRAARPEAASASAQSPTNPEPASASVGSDDSDSSTAESSGPADAIHRSVLAGLLSHLGMRDDLQDRRAPADRARGTNPASSRRKPAQEYVGARGTRFALHPGSVLSKKPPEVVMCVELVETSRLFARGNATVDPAWAEELAGPLAKRQLSEPHWEKKQGAAVAYERVTLYGVPIVARRRVQLSRFDREQARELFIRHALVEGDWESPQAFDRANRQLRRELQQLEERTRRRDLVGDDDAVFEFYDARIPAEVTSTRDFEGWWKREQRTQPKLLTMRREDLLQDEDPQAADETEFPREWRHGDQTLRLRYRFEPGASDDGVTVAVPLPLLPRVVGNEFEKLVPGLREELVTALIRSLPKAIRKHIVPAADWARTLLASVEPKLEGSPSSLTELLADEIRRRTSVQVSSSDFDSEKLPAHLTPTFRVIDGRGRTVGSGKDLAALQRTHRDQATKGVARVAQAALPKSDLERTGLTEWNFGDIPRHVDTAYAGGRSGTGTVRAYPALVDRRTSVELRLVADAEEQARLTRRGVRRLLTLSSPSPASYVRDHLSNQEKLLLSAGPYRSLDDAIADVSLAVADRAILRTSPDGLVWNAHDFDSIANDYARALIDDIYGGIALTAKVLNEARLANRAIESAKSLHVLGQVTDAKAQLNGLVYAATGGSGFVSRTGLDRLARVPVYLQAIGMRMNGLTEQSGRDRVWQNETDHALALFRDAGGEIPLPIDAPAHLVRARWLIEELRVSLFAQQLRTAEPVSLQRVQKAISGG